MNKTLLLVLLCWCALVPSRQASAASLYVDTQSPSAKDSNSGSQTSPWKTIQKAASTAAAGDTVIVKAGEYNEFVTSRISGTAGSAITFTGERGTNGEWLTILDPSTPFMNGWVAATEIGTGVWKQSSVSFRTFDLTIDHERVAGVYTLGDMTEYITNAYIGSDLTAGSNFLTLATDVTLNTSQNHSTVYFWDGVEAMWGTLSNASLTTWTLYLRLRDGSDPNGINIRAVPASYSLNLSGQSYLVISNFLVRGGYYNVLLQDGSCHHNTIVSNYISGGYTGVLMQSKTHDNSVSYNEITENYYGYNDPGAWGETAASAYKYVIRENIYLVSKFLMGRSTTYYRAVELYNVGNSNVVFANHIFKSVGSGISIGNDIFNYGYATNTLICGNSIEGHTSVGITPSWGEIGTRIYDNLISDCNCNLRFHFLNQSGDSNRLVYVHRNRFWLPTGVSDHIFTWSGQTGVTNECATVWVYHNSFSGGVGALRDNGYAKYNGGLRNFHFLNNIFSRVLYVNPNSWGIGMWTNRLMLGTFDYNEVAPLTPTWLSSEPKAAWYGPHNITNSSAEWPSAQGMSFVLASGSKAIDTAIDVTQPFVIAGVTNAGLPAAGQARSAGAWDRGALENNTGLQPPAELHRIEPAN